MRCTVVSAIHLQNNTWFYLINLNYYGRLLVSTQTHAHTTAYPICGDLIVVLDRNRNTHIFITTCRLLCYLYVRQPQQPNNTKRWMFLNFLQEHIPHVSGNVENSLCLAPVNAVVEYNLFGFDIKLAHLLWQQCTVQKNNIKET